MKRRRANVLRVVAIAVTALAVASSAATTRTAAAALPPGNTVAQWNQITEDTVLGVGMLADEGFIYMAYPSAAVYDAVVAIEGGFEPYGPAIDAPAGASVDAAVVEAAYRTLSAYFTPESCNASISASGMPHRPKPPTASVWPSATTPLSAASAEG